MIADTSFVIDILRRRDSAAMEKLQELERREEIIFLTPVTVFELWHGAAISVNRNEAYKVSELLGRMPVLVLDEHSARVAGLISGDLFRRGSTIEVTDCMIAGVALEKNQALITKNTKHFGRINGLKLETY